MQQSLINIIFSNASVDLLRQYLSMIEVNGFAFRTNFDYQNTPENLSNQFEPFYTTERPNDPILPSIRQPGRWHWWAVFSKPLLPDRSWFRQQAPVLRSQLIESLSSDVSFAFPECFALYAGTAEDVEAIIRDSFHLYIDTTSRHYLALLVSISPARREEAFQIVIDELDKALNPARFALYAGCYLYDFGIENDSLVTVELSQKTQIIATCFADVIKFTSPYSDTKGPYLPPPYLLKVDANRPFYLQVLSLAGAETVDKEEPIEDVLTALRLFQPGFIGRGEIMTWTTGVGRYSNIDYRVDPAVTKMRQGQMFRDKPSYNLQLSDFSKIRELIGQLRNSPIRKKLDFAIK